MARIRSIKPEFFTSEQIVECSTSARLLFVGLWCFCDDAGRHPASVRRLKMEVFPGDSFSVEQVETWVNELIAAGLISAYESQGVAYWWVTGWDKHQKIDRPTVKFPGPFDEGSTSIRRCLDEGSTSPRDGEERSRREGRGEEKVKATPLSPNGDMTATRFFELYQTFAKSKGLAVPADLTDERRKKINTRLKTEGWIERFREAIGHMPIPNTERFTWQPDIDWLIANGTNVVKLAEGSYDRKQPDADGPAEGCDHYD
jgi:hypothetical protein